MAETRRWLRHAGDSSTSLAQDTSALTTAALIASMTHEYAQTGIIIRQENALLSQSRASVAVSAMRVAAQITPFGRGTGGHAGGQVSSLSAGRCACAWCSPTSPTDR